MTVDQVPPKSGGGWPESAAELVHTGDWYGAPDVQLQWMADTADSCGPGIGITLVVPGGTISGTVISAENFFKSSAETFRDHIPGEQQEIGEILARSFFDQPAEQNTEHVKTVNEAFQNGEREEPRWPLVRQIHLQDARFSAPGQEHIPLGNTRILLSQVIAWTVGQRWVGPCN